MRLDRSERRHRRQSHDDVQRGAQPYGRSKGDPDHHEVASRTPQGHEDGSQSDRLEDPVQKDGRAHGGVGGCDRGQYGYAREARHRDHYEPEDATGLEPAGQASTCRGPVNARSGGPRRGHADCERSDEDRLEDHLNVPHLPRNVGGVPEGRERQYEEQRPPRAV